MTDDLCPCCNQVWPRGRTKADAKRVAASALTVIVSPRKRKLVEILADRFGCFVEAGTLAHILYSEDPNGGPYDAIGVVRVLIHRLKADLAKVGLIIEGKIYRGYRLRWAEQESGVSVHPPLVASASVNTAPVPGADAFVSEGK